MRQRDKLHRQTSLPGEYTDAVGPPSTALGNFPVAPPIGLSRKPVRTTRFNTYSVVSTINPSVLAGQNAQRVYMAFMNLGAVDAYISFGSVANLNGTNSFKLPPNTGITFENGIVPNNDVTVVSSVGCLISVAEGVSTYA